MFERWLGSLVLVLTASLGLAGCSDGNEPDDNDDGGADGSTDTDSDTDTDTDAGLACPGLLEEICADAEPVETLEVLVTSTDLMVSAFVDIADLALLAYVDSPMKDGGGETSLFFANKDGFEGDPPLWEAVELPAEARYLQPVALADGYFDGPAQFAWTALLCEGQNLACGFWTAADPDEDGTPVLAPVENGEVPATGELRGASFFYNWLETSEPLLCAFGDGIYCFDGTSWTTEIEAGQGPLFNDLDCDRNQDGYCCAYVAVGDDGRRAHLSFSSGGWVDGFAETDEDLLVLSDSGLVAGGTGGVLYGRAACEVAGSRVVGLSAGWWNLPPETPPDVPVFVELAGVTANRQLFFTSYSSFEDGGFTALECGAIDTTGDEATGSALAARQYFCGIVPNLLVLSESALYGTWSCAVD